MPIITALSAEKWLFPNPMACKRSRVRLPSAPLAAKLFAPFLVKISPARWLDWYLQPADGMRCRAGA